VALLGPHTAALGMRFYTGSMFPAEYKNAIFIARHGSWNKSKKLGGDIVVAKLNRTARSSPGAVHHRVLQDNNYIGRPVDLAVMKDGSLLDLRRLSGAVYRVTYNGRVASVRPVAAARHRDCLPGRRGTGWPAIPNCGPPGNIGHCAPRSWPAPS